MSPDPLSRRWGLGTRLSGHSIVSSPDPTYERGSGDIWLIPGFINIDYFLEGNINIDYFLERNISPPITLQKRQLQCNTGNSWLLQHDDTALFLAHKLVIGSQLCIQQAMNF